MRIRLTIHLSETELAALAAQGPYRHERPLNKNHYTQLIAGLLYADLDRITREYLEATGEGKSRGERRFT